MKPLFIILAALAVAAPVHAQQRLPRLYGNLAGFDYCRLRAAGVPHHQALQAAVRVLGAIADPLELQPGSDPAWIEAAEAAYRADQLAQQQRNAIGLPDDAPDWEEPTTYAAPAPPVAPPPMPARPPAPPASPAYARPAGY